MDKKFNIGLFAVFIALLTLICVLICIFLPARNSKTAVITSDGEIIMTLDLNRYLNGKSDLFTVQAPNGGENVIQVKDGKISVISATCPDKICVSQGERGVGCNNPSPIVCLPNRLSITLNENSDTDAVAK